MRETKINIRDYRKIILVGASGSGKSWLAKDIAKLTGYPLHHLDNEFWKPGWVKTPKDEFIQRQEEIISGENWIIDGDYSSTLEMRFTAADLIILLDTNRLISVLSAAKRHGKKRSDLPDYLNEDTIWDKEFLGLCKYIWTYPRNGRRIVITLHEKYFEKTFLRVKSRREAKKIVKKWSRI